jgi:hypothetical protein
MKQAIFSILFGILGVSCIGQGSIQIPPGTYPACGTGPGFYRPQSVTLSGGFPPKIIRNPGTYYAPTGDRLQYWNQYYPTTNTYGPREPNPYSANGNLSVTRTFNHLYHTRVVPAVQRRVTQYRRP